MSTANVSGRAKGAVASTPQMPRRLTKIKAGATGPVHLSFIVDAGLVRDVDDEADRMKSEDPYGRVVSRTDAVRSLIIDGLKSRADRRSK